LQGHPARDCAAGRGQIGGPVDADGIAANRGNAPEPRTAAFGEHDIGYATPVVLASQRRNDLRHIAQRKLIVLRGRQNPAPGIE
jgi:hypothetical protein